MKLLEPHTLKNLTLKNRVVMEPMCMYSCFNHDGCATSFHQAHYTSRAIGQVGLILVEATGVCPEGRITDRCLGLYNDSQKEALKKVVDAVHQEGSMIGIQINHAGRKCTAVDGVDTIYGPSACAYDASSRIPHELTLAEIQHVFHQFKEAARRADEAGFDVLEIHGAHGYLISQFMSPCTNKRTDAYRDGSLFIHGVIKAVKESWPETKPLIIRVSATDYEPHGYQVEDTIRMLKPSLDMLDAINVSSGGITPIPPTKIYPGYQIGFAHQIKHALNIPVIGCGLLGSSELASYLIESETVDFIGLARPLLRNPHWVLETAINRNKRESVPPQYERGFK